MSAIDWELIRKRMILMRYQPAYFASTPAPPVSNWILALGVWNDGGEWIDAENWVD